jgi:hypothetical protein
MQQLNNNVNLSHAITGEHIMHSSLSQTNSSVYFDLITTAIKATKQQCYCAAIMINKETSPQHITKK